MIGTVQVLAFTCCAYYKAVNLPSFSRLAGHGLRINARKRIFEPQNGWEKKKVVKTFHNKWPHTYCPFLSWGVCYNGVEATGK
jgi:hypothetical protein